MLMTVISLNDTAKSEFVKLFLSDSLRLTSNLIRKR